MVATISINDTLILDQTSGIQDDDGALAADLLTLATPFRTALLGLVGDLALSAGQLSFAASAKGAFSSANYVTVNPDGATINDLFFSDPDGNAFDGDQVIYNGSPLQTVNGDNIYLWSLGDGDIVIATTSGTSGVGDVVAAFYLDDAANFLSATIQMVTFIPLDHPDDTNPDDRVDWTDLLNVTASGSLFFDFDALKSGSSLWVAVGSASAGILVTGGTPIVDAGTGKKTNASDVIHTSQGGQGATIGVNNQLFDNVGETGVFTLVTGLDTITGDDGATGDYVVDPNLNDAKLEGIDYDGYLNVTGAGIFISQSQGSPSTTKDFDINLLTAGSGTTPEEGFGYVSGLASDTAVNVGSVTVINDDGEVVGIWGVGGVASGTALASSSANGNTIVTVSISGNNIDVNGVFGEFTVRWTSAGGATFNRFTLVSEAGQFDVGGVEITQGLKITEPVGDSLFVDDDGPAVDLVLKGTAELTVDESSLPVPPTDSITAADLFTITESFGTDGAGAAGGVYELVLGADVTSGLFDTDTGLEVILSINAAGTLISGKVNDGGLVDVFTIAINSSTGEVTLTQYRAMVNGDPNDPDESDTPLGLAAGTVSVQRTITDADDDEASDIVDISSIFKFEDDGPVQPPVGEDVDNLITDDSFITDSATESTDDIFPDAPNFGADGPRAIDPIIISLRLDDTNPGDGDDPDSGLIDTATGDAIRFVTVGDDIVGYVDLNGDGVISAGEKILANEAVRYSLVAVDSDSYDVTFTQSRAVFHALAATEETVLANTVFIQREAYDGDGDPAEVVDFDLGAITFLLDDEPTIGPIPDGLVDFALNDFVTNSLFGDVNNDPNASPYILTDFTLNVSAGSVALKGVLAADSKSVTYYADTDGDTVFGSGGDTAYYTMVLGNQGGAGNYTFTVLVEPGPAFTEFTFDLLPSGANLFGIVASEDSALLVMGENPDFNAAGNYTNASDVIHTSQGGTGATIGVNNQMFDPGDGAYFTFINDPDPDFISGIAGGLSSTEADNINNVQYNEDLAGPPTLEVSTAFLGISQTQSNKPVSMTIEAFNITGGPQEEAFAAALGQNHVNVTEVRVYDGDGTLLENSDGSVNHADITISFSGGVATVGGLLRDYTVQWDTDAVHDQVLITGATGKFDIGKFGFLETNEIPDQLLSFTAQVTDGDGDTASDSWNIGIDGTGSFDNDSVSGVII
jgi:hypothetical protein